MQPHQTFWLTALGVARTKVHEHDDSEQQRQAETEAWRGKHDRGGPGFEGRTILSHPSLLSPSPTTQFSACELLEGIASPPRDEVPRNRPHQRSEDHPRVDHISRHDPGSDRLRDVHSKEQECDEVKEAAQTMRVRGRNMRVDTIVAIELPLSCSPLKASNASATTIRAARIGRLTWLTSSI